LVAIASATLGFAGDRFAGPHPDVRFALALFSTGLSLLGSAAICVSAAWPVRFALVGALPENWWSDGVTTRSYEECLRRESNNYTDRIRDNRQVIRRNAQRLRLGMYLACGSPLIGLFSWIAACPFL
jgi:hypothetical protein